MVFFPCPRVASPLSVKTHSAEPRSVGGETDLPTGALGVRISRTTPTSPFWFVDPLIVHTGDTAAWRGLLHTGASCPCCRPFLRRGGVAGCVAEGTLGSHNHVPAVAPFLYSVSPRPVQCLWYCQWITETRQTGKGKPGLGCVNSNQDRSLHL